MYTIVFVSSFGYQSQPFFGSNQECKTHLQCRTNVVHELENQHAIAIDYKNQRTDRVASVSEEIRKRIGDVFQHNRLRAFIAQEQLDKPLA